jgi:predicted ABC-type transport system involved in lysophospholipase L1 biosynthesis ATPase subunit
MDNNIIIEIKDLKKDYHVGEVTIHALRGIDLQIRKGEFVAIMGMSGSGKSTMLNILGCLDKPSSGDYYLDGTDVKSLSKDELARLRNKKLGFVFQSYNLLPRATAPENVELPLFYDSKVKSGERTRKAIDALGVFFGFLIAKVAGSLMNNPAVVTTQSVVLAFAVCFIIGVFFGWYPAREAASLNPIEALRYE